MEAYVARGVDPLGRRPGRGAGDRLGDLQVRGVPDLRRPGRGRRRVPHPPPGPHRVPLRLPRRHLPARAQQRLARWCPWPWSSPPGSPPTGDREVLGLDVGDSEDEVFWRGFLTLAEAARPGRGAAGHLRPARRPGRRAARASFQGAAHQRCRVHFARNLLALVPKSHDDMVAAVFRTIFAQPDADTVASHLGRRSATSSPTGSPRSAR